LPPPDPPIHSPPLPRERAVPSFVARRCRRHLRVELREDLGPDRRARAGALDGDADALARGDELVGRAELVLAEVALVRVEVVERPAAAAAAVVRGEDARERLGRSLAERGRVGVGALVVDLEVVERRLLRAVLRLGLLRLGLGLEVVVGPDVLPRWTFGR
jgi:hypothetical protein